MKTRVLLLLLVGSACDQKTPPPPPPVEAAVTSTASAAPEPPRPPLVTVDDGSVVVSGDKVAFGGADAKGRIAGLLESKPLVAGQTLEVDALRDTTMAHFAIAIAALRDAKVAAAKVKTSKRDQSVGTLDVAIEHAPPPACAAVAMVAKDNSIEVWPYGGAVAQRFTHGFAGPDITLGSAALVKRAGDCNAPNDFVSGDDSIKWGVVFDLALAAAQTPGFKPKSAVVLTKPPVPGRKVSEE